MIDPKHIEFNERRDDVFDDPEFRTALLSHYTGLKIKYQKEVAEIESANVFNKAVLYNDFKKAAKVKEVKEHKGFFKKIFDSILGLSDSDNTDIEDIFTGFEQSIHKTPLSSILEVDDISAFEEYYLEIRNYVISHKDSIVTNIRNKVLYRFIKNEGRNHRYEIQSNLSHSLPLILELRAFLNDIFSLKESHLANLDSLQDKKFKLIMYSNANNSQSNYLMLT